MAMETLRNSITSVEQKEKGKTILEKMEEYVKLQALKKKNSPTVVSQHLRCRAKNWSRTWLKHRTPKGKIC